MGRLASPESKLLMCLFTRTVLAGDGEVVVRFISVVSGPVGLCFLCNIACVLVGVVDCLLMAKPVSQINHLEIRLDRRTSFRCCRLIVVSFESGDARFNLRLCRSCLELV